MSPASGSVFGREGLGGLPIIDGHCHPLLRDFMAPTLDQFRRLLTESREQAILAHHAPALPLTRRLLQALGTLYGVPAEEAAVLEARTSQLDAARLRELFRAQHVAALLVDDGYPPNALSIEEMRRVLPCRVHRVLRLERLAETLILKGLEFEEFQAAFRAELEAAPAHGVVAFKSIVAYRSGLEVGPVTEAEARDAYEAVRREARGQERLRLVSKPLLDFLLGEALARAAELDLPLQLHTGFGDADLDLLKANPLLLRPLLTSQEARGAKVVLLHLGYPYYREAAYLAGLHSGVYVDCSLALPYLQETLVPVLRELLGLAPWTKLLYGSDLYGIPELYWFAAGLGREVVGRTLEMLVEDRMLTREDALRAAEGILAGNALTLYRLPQDAPAGPGPH
ncbi:MAG: amidohydrolase family protein [Deltaproteobacteria bacterium]|nr:amidohydrolase family protein [Deltaproteobacteria bacterium]